MVDHLSIAVYVFPIRMLISFSVDEMLLSMYVKWPINFRVLSINVLMAPSCLKHEIRFIWVHVEAKDTCCSLQAIQWTFGKSKCIARSAGSYAMSTSIIISASYLFKWDHFLFVDLLTFLVRNLNRLLIDMVLIYLFARLLRQCWRC